MCPRKADLPLLERIELLTFCIERVKHHGVLLANVKDESDRAEQEHFPNQDIVLWKTKDTVKALHNIHLEAASFPPYMRDVMGTFDEELVVAMMRGLSDPTGSVHIFACALLMPPWLVSVLSHLQPQPVRCAEI